MSRLFTRGVEVRNTFEDFFLPLTEDHELKPVMLVLVLDLYFRLVPHTMVVDTPEVAELARLMKLKPEKVVQVLETFQACDPYLMRTTEASPSAFGSVSAGVEPLRQWSTPPLWGGGAGRFCFFFG